MHELGLVVIPPQKSYCSCMHAAAVIIEGISKLAHDASICVKRDCAGIVSEIAHAELFITPGGHADAVCWAVTLIRT